jgi:uncharacterized protein YcgI (DUF1989 family)
MSVMELTNTTSHVVVPAGAGRAVLARRGDHVRVIDVEGGQDSGDYKARQGLARTVRLVTTVQEVPEPTDV